MDQRCVGAVLVDMTGTRTYRATIGALALSLAAVGGACGSAGGGSGEGGSSPTVGAVELADTTITPTTGDGRTATNGQVTVNGSVIQSGSGGVVIDGNGNVSINGTRVGAGTNTVAVAGSGVLLTEDRGLSGFHAVDVQGAANVDITVADQDAVSVTADDNVLPLVRTEVVDGHLVVGLQPGTVLAGAHVSVVVQTAHFDALRSSGSASITATGLAGTPLAVELEGSGDLALHGSTSDLQLTTSGSADVEAGELVADRATVRVAGSGDVRVHAATVLDASVAGSGDIVYTGAPATVTTAVLGSGDIVAG